MRAWEDDKLHSRNLSGAALGAQRLEQLKRK
jgi:hypothetical protein